MPQRNWGLILQKGDTVDSPTEVPLYQCTGNKQEELEATVQKEQKGAGSSLRTFFLEHKSSRFPCVRNQARKAGDRHG